MSFWTNVTGECCCHGRGLLIWGVVHPGLTLVDPHEARIQGFIPLTPQRWTVCVFVLSDSLLSHLILQVAHHYPTIRHLTQTPPHAWPPKRVGTQPSFLYAPHGVGHCGLMQVFDIGGAQWWDCQTTYTNLQSTHMNLKHTVSDCC